MDLGFEVRDFSPPAHPKGLSLRGRSVRLEPLIASRFAAELFAANAVGDGSNWDYLPYGPFGSEGEYAQWIESYEDSLDPCFFAIIGEASGRALGVASYLRIAPEVGTIEVGHIHYSPLLQASFAGTEAMFLMMRWVFEAGYRRYEWKCNALNRRSRRAAQRLGFSYEGIFRQATIAKGRNRDTAWFAMIDKEWEAIRECFARYLAAENWGEDGSPKLSLSSMTAPILHKKDNLEGL